VDSLLVPQIVYFVHYHLVSWVDLHGYEKINFKKKKKIEKIEKSKKSKKRRKNDEKKRKKTKNKTFRIDLHNVKCSITTKVKRQAHFTIVIMGLRKEYINEVVRERGEG
jgi:hypothetical protein